MLKQCVIPQKLKELIVMPAYKKGKTFENIDSYRLSKKILSNLIVNLYSIILLLSSLEIT
jgi:hypothetical protein